MLQITLSVVTLRDVVALARNEISILQQTTQELRTIVTVCDKGVDPLVRQSLDHIDAPLAAALVRQTSHASILDELTGELHGSDSDLPSERSER